MRECKNMNDVQRLQAELDRVIIETKKIPAEKITPNGSLMSAIAETVEFIEESLDTYKVWKDKTKDYSEKKLKEELIDVLFFLVQYANRVDWKLNQDWEYLWELNKECKCDNLLNMTLWLQSKISGKEVYQALSIWVCIAQNLGLSKEDVYDLYLEKWELNLQRNTTKIENGGWRK